MHSPRSRSFRCHVTFIIDVSRQTLSSSVTSPRYTVRRTFAIAVSTSLRHPTSPATFVAWRMSSRVSNQRSASTDQLVVPRVRCSTIGGLAFPVAAARTWNSLPPHVTSSPSLPAFKQSLKTELFKRSYPTS